MPVEDQYAAEPENDGYQAGAEELRYRVGEVIPAVDAVERLPGSIDQAVEAFAELVFGIEGFDYPQTGERFFHLA